MISPATATKSDGLRAGNGGARPEPALVEVISPVAVAVDQPPLLQIVVDTEEEFDWGKPFDSSSVTVRNIGHQGPAQQIFERFGGTPTYVVDYAVSSQSHGFGPLKEWLDDGRCTIGAHLQPWVNPPLAEEINDVNSYPSNLPPALERAKLEILTEMIGRNFGQRPLVYRAGRYGLGSRSLEIIEDLGYEVDSSVLPACDLRRLNGPDFTRLRGDPFWFGRQRRLLGIPLTVGHTGWLSNHGERLYRFLDHPIADACRAKALASRLHILDRVSLSPEGMRLSELIRLTRTLLARGQRIFNFSYHSPSLLPGSTPYVRSQGDLDRFLARIEQFLEFFVTEAKGQLTTPLAIKANLEKASGGAEPSGRK